MSGYMNEYAPSNKPICQKISCPYWSGGTNNYGCQAYPSAGLCHLHGASSKLCDDNQYVLYPAFTVKAPKAEHLVSLVKAISEHVEVAAKNSGTVPNLKELCAVDG